jgi:hypothetical protein
VLPNSYKRERFHFISFVVGDRQYWAILVSPKLAAQDPGEEYVEMKKSFELTFAYVHLVLSFPTYPWSRQVVAVHSHQPCNDLMCTIFERQK